MDFFDSAFSINGNFSAQSSICPPKERLEPKSTGTYNTDKRKKQTLLMVCLYECFSSVERI